MEAIVAIVRLNTLCGAAIAATMITVSPALGRDTDIDDGGCKTCPSWRSPASSEMPPVVPGAPHFPEDFRRVTVCYLVKERIGTHNGHAVYRTLQSC
jgi:hypothetical protein